MVKTLDAAAFRSADAGQKVNRAALNRAVRWPRIARPITDMAFSMIAARSCQCIKCGWESSLAKFGSAYVERQGLVTVHCSCPDCGTRWQRIEVGRAL